MWTGSTSELTPFLPGLRCTTKMSADMNDSPEWGRVDAEIAGPGELYKWESSWTFGTLDDSTCES